MVKITDELLKETFSKTYLNNVTFEIRFPADLTIKDKIPEFQKLIRNEFQIYSERFPYSIPIQVNVEKGILLNYTFAHDKKKLELYLNTYSVFGLATKNYLGFEKFSKIFLDQVKLFTNLCEIELITRLGIRYINIIPLKKDLIESNKMMKNYFNLLVSNEFNNINFEDKTINLRYDENDYKIRQVFIFRKNDPMNRYEVIIDLDNSFNKTIKIKTNMEVFRKKIDDLHDLIKKKFLKNIKEEFLKILREENGDKD